MNHSTPSVATLLSNLKSTIELLIQFRGDSLTSKYGAVERLRSPILAILTHGLKQSTGDIYEQLWQIIVRLNANSQRHIHLLQDIYHKENIRISVEQWIDQSVINQCLSDQLSSSEKDEDLLPQYYHGNAFLRIPAFYQALSLCVRTIEYSDPSLLINIDPNLSIAGLHHPSLTNTGADRTNPSTSVASPVPVTNKIFSPVLVTERKSKDDNQAKLHSLAHRRIVHRRIHSDPIFSIPKDNNHFVQNNRSQVTSPVPTAAVLNDFNTSEAGSVPSVSYFQPDTYGSYGSSNDSRGDLSDASALLYRNRQPKVPLNQPPEPEDNRHSKSSQITLINEDDGPLYHHRLSPVVNHEDTILSTTSTSPMDQSVIVTTTDNPTRTARLPHSSLFWPRKGQTLDDYIRESDSKTHTDVEKENAHFYLSEAIISAIEQIKFTQQCNRYFGQSWSSSIASLISPCETMHTSSSNSSTSPPVQQYTPCNSKLVRSQQAKVSTVESTTTDDQHSEMIESTTDSAEPPNTFDWSVRSCVLSSNLEESSAEAIALTLMDTWKNYKVPAATELLWMIPHDEDFPQKLLPLPDGISVDPSDDFLLMDGDRRISCRGNDQWAPPREQLIFHIHSSSSRDAQLRDQHYLCAGCGRHVEKAYARLYRYCEYTDKYYCRSCHANKRSFLPSYIIAKWDFSTKHYVSNFAFDYLNRIRNDPLFNLNDLNRVLFEKSRKLRLINDLRWSLYFLQQYILHCRLAQEHGDQLLLKKLPSYLFTTPYVYSIQDLFKTKSGDLLKVLDPIVNSLREHVLLCAICSGQGHICQICRNRDDIIFPFDLENTSVCQACQSCFHLTCHENQQFSCPKCPRHKIRSSLRASNRSTTPTNVAPDDAIVS